VTERVLEALAQRSPELIALIWAIWYTGRRIDRLSGAIAGKLEKLTQALGELRAQIAVLLDRGERVR